MANELKESRIAGPFKKGSIPDAHVSRFGVIPKKSSGKWRLIVDLSHPQGSSVNDAIPKELCSLTYITIDTAIKHILTLGPGTLLAKLDIKNAFRIKSELHHWLKKRRATKRQILSLVGLLQHASKVVVPGRTFTSHMYSKAARVKKLHYFTKLDSTFRSDLHWWHTFISTWNGRSFLHVVNQQVPTDCCIYTDASGSWGCGGFFREKWLQFAWTAEWSEIGIMTKELLPIVISCAVWGPKLYQKSIQVQCDNTGAVSAINKGSSKDKTAMHLLCCPWFFAALFQIRIIATHIPGIANTAADMLSRNLLIQFQEAYPQASQFPSYVPIPLLTLLSPKQLDWTSPGFLSLFQETLSIIHKETE